MKKGFTLIEILIVIFIMSILIAISVTAFVSYGKRQNLEKAARIVLSTLDEARSSTLSSRGGSAYGVHFDGTSATIFTGPTYSAGTASNKVNKIDPSVTISFIGLTGGGSDVLFQRLSGATDQNGTVILSLAGDASVFKIVIIYNTGIAQDN